MENDFSKIALQSGKHDKVQTVMHYVNKENLAEEHQMQKSGKSTGIDKVSKEQYAENLDANLENLITRRYQQLLRKHPIVQPKLYVDIWT